MKSTNRLLQSRIEYHRDGYQHHKSRILPMNKTKSRVFLSLLTFTTTVRMFHPCRTFQEHFRFLSSSNLNDGCPDNKTLDNYPAIPFSKIFKRWKRYFFMVLVECGGDFKRWSTRKVKGWSTLSTTTYRTWSQLFEIMAHRGVTPLYSK